MPEQADPRDDRGNVCGRPRLVGDDHLVLGLLGISPTAAERWAAGAVRTAYAAEVARRSDG
ncbi:hypothetical protein SipoB123_14830 [Streptomyces ipomoeae]|nr:hypothetical protein SipoB123_14830 [Streptomyces ipomoeae]